MLTHVCVLFTIRLDQSKKNCNELYFLQLKVLSKPSAQNDSPDGATSSQPVKNPRIKTIYVTR